jgi:hypothetical protein
MRVVRGIVGVAVLSLLALSASAEATATRFTTPVQLTGAGGGEPTIVADSLGDVYVVGPQGIPSGLNDQPGVGFWASRNDGTTFATAQQIGSFAGGGDSDAAIMPNSDLYVADLEAVASAVCKSTDRGKTFTSIGPIPDPGHCSMLPTGQVGPSDDRQWLTPDRQGHLYLTYHEFVSAQPLVFRSDNGGGDLFTAGPCGSIVTDPTIEANIPQDVTGGTLVSKPVTDKAGNLYIMFTTTTQQENVAAALAGKPSGTFSQIYLAVSKDHCQSFTDYTVYDGAATHGMNTVQFGDIFNALAIDGAGDLYSIAAGYVGSKAFDNVAKLYLFSSSDQGVHWTGPTELGQAGAKMMPAAVAGTQAGQLAIGYFRTVNGVTDPNNTTAKWTYSTAETRNATSAHPSFSYADVRPGFVYHTGEICNQGILCGLVPGGPSDRSLADFTSAALARNGCPLFSFAGNPAGVNAGTFNFATRQTSNCFGTAVARQVPPKSTPKLANRPVTSSPSLANTGLNPAVPTAGLGLVAIALLVVRGRQRGRLASTAGRA